MTHKMSPFLASPQTLTDKLSASLSPVPQQNSMHLSIHSLTVKTVSKTGSYKQAHLYLTSYKSCPQTLQDSLEGYLHTKLAVPPVDCK